MALFKRKPAPRDEGHDTSRDVKANTKDIIQVAQETKRANRHLAEVLERNHITIRIYSQLGGRYKRGGE